jgi:hypothetical protein
MRESDHINYPISVVCVHSWPYRHKTGNGYSRIAIKHLIVFLLIIIHCTSEIMLNTFCFNNLVQFSYEFPCPCVSEYNHHINQPVVLKNRCTFTNRPVVSSVFISWLRSCSRLFFLYKHFVTGQHSKCPVTQSATAHSTEWGLFSRISCSHCTVQSNTWAMSRFSTGNIMALYTNSVLLVRSAITTVQCNPTHEPGEEASATSGGSDWRTCGSCTARPWRVSAWWRSKRRKRIVIIVSWNVQKCGTNYTVITGILFAQANWFY